MSRVLSHGEIENAKPVSFEAMSLPQPNAGFRARFGEGQEDSWAPTHASEAPASGEEIDPVEQFRADAFAEGFAAGSRVTRESLEEEAHARERLAEAIAQLAPAQSGALSTMLSQAVLHIVTQIVGTAPVDVDLLRARVEAVAAFIEAEQDKACLRVHPDDIPLLEGFALGTPLEPDAGLTRGSVRLETGDGWIEDGPDVQLARLRAVLDGAEGAA